MAGDLTGDAEAVFEPFYNVASRRSHSGRTLFELTETQAILETGPEIRGEVAMLAIRQHIVCAHRDHTNYPLQHACEGLISRLLQGTVALDEGDWIEALAWCSGRYGPFPWGFLLKQVSKHIKARGLSTAMDEALATAQGRVAHYVHPKRKRDKLVLEISAMRGVVVEKELVLDTQEPWADQLMRDLARLDDEDERAMQTALAEAAISSGSKPSAKWMKQVLAHLEGVDAALVRSALTVWITLFNQPRAEVPEARWPLLPNIWSVAEGNADLMKGMIWLTTRYTDDGLVRAVAAAGLSGQKKVPTLGPRSSKITNAAVWALSQIDSPLAIGQLAVLRSKIKNKSTQKQIDKAVNAIAHRLGMPPDEVEEMAVPTYGLTDVGVRRESLGDFTAELHVTGTTSTGLVWIKPDGKPQKTVPKVVKDDHADDLKELKAAAKDIQKLIPAQRDRIDLLHLRGKAWDYNTWAERYLDHPLVGTVARRLIWDFEDEGGKRSAAWLEGNLVDADGEPVALNHGRTRVSLWHPIGQGIDAVTGWRIFFEERQIKQPFKQAHREVYLLTDAERTTRVYSNRFASHVIRQHQFKALAEQRGWRYALQGCFDTPDEVAVRWMPEHQLKAEFWVDRPWGDGEDEYSESGIFFRVVTDQVRFFPIESTGRDTWHNRGEVADDSIPLDQIDPLVFSEVMRDVDLFVGVGSVGNDPAWHDGGPEGRYHDYWHDYAFGELAATANTRRDILERLVPRLKIADRCSFEDKFLVVRGDLRTYKIHLGSSNILMSPNDQYLCIVQGRGGAKIGDKVFLPFEGDSRLAVILSKAMMLAEDTKIKDKTIVSQINAK